MPDARRARDHDPARLSADPAARRPVRAYGPVSGRARPRSLAVATGLLRLSLGRDRQPRRRPSGDSARQADRPRMGGEGNRARDPAAYRRRLPVGRARGSRPGSADRILRAPLHLRLPVPVRLRELHLVGGAGVPGVRTLAEAGAARADRASRVAVRPDLARRLLLPHLRLGPARSDVLLGRRGPASRPRPHLVARGDRGGAANLGDGLADPHHADLAQRDPRRSDGRLVQLEDQMALDLFGAPRPLAMVRHRLAHRGCAGVPLCNGESQADSSRATSPSPRSCSPRGSRSFRGSCSARLMRTCGLSLI